MLAHLCTRQQRLIRLAGQQHCGEKHLHRHLAEYDFRYSRRVALGHSDIDRTKAAIRAAAHSGAENEAEVTVSGPVPGF